MSEEYPDGGPARRNGDDADSDDTDDTAATHDTDDTRDITNTHDTDNTADTDDTRDITNTHDTDNTADTDDTYNVGDTNPFEQLSAGGNTDVSDPWADLKPTAGGDGVDAGRFDSGSADADAADFDFSAVDEWADAVVEERRTGRRTWTDGVTVGETPLDAPDGDDTPVEVGDGETYVVSKRHYCQTCPHFESPPGFGCGHEGTDIVETVGFERFRVRDCPMVDDDGGAGSSRRAAHAVADAPGGGRARRDAESEDGSD
ncbi:hypothetical protein [Haloprofundus sp. MHR1]|uniref:hypothetical protein n=1 Tax=Haloprofundus sp. MHR1 TaxID=2572921 RepID=UPI0010BF127B|nr:hypothetical protein [Haloprofundus sp. MHR1]QCJ46087.1 hypothetical protein FCF25_02665 [Haloprofundus sp. MHR1]